jgi:hypothetical protein
MNRIVDNHEYIDQYNWSSLITETDNQEIMRVVKSIIDNGNYFKNSPKFQTQENLFARQETVFLKMRQSFIYSCFMFLGGEVRIKNMMSWCFMTSQNEVENREDLWHTHHLNDNNGTTNTLSGVWYVNIPKSITNYDTAGTEFCLDWANKQDYIYLRPNNLTWNIYPSKLWHRPGIIDTDEYRFVFAADMEYYK